METFLKCCKICLETKSSDDFYFHKDPKDKRRGECKVCSNKKNALWQKANKEKRNISTKRWQLKNTEAYKQLLKRTKARQLQIKYNLSGEQHALLLQKQLALCAICQLVMHTPKKPLHVDHDHATGKVRGLLCHGCNVGIGFMKDDTELLKKAIEYLHQSLRS